MRPPSLGFHLRTFASTIAISLAVNSGPSWALTRTCGSDPLANTADVLCASPSGPCTSSQVTLGANIDVTAGGCVFDIGGRALVVQNTLQVIGGPDGFIRIQNASAIAVTSTGKLKTRGDFVKVDGQIVDGGSIDLESASTITIQGRLDASGNPAGRISLLASSNVAVAASAFVQASGQSNQGVEDQSADGGRLEIITTGGSVSLDGTIALDGQSIGGGGTLIVRAPLDLTISHSLDLSGGAGGGGEVDAQVGDNIAVTAPISADSRLSGGAGGTIGLTAGDDNQGGVVDGGTLTVQNAVLKVDGSTGSTGDDGSGGSVALAAHGALQLLGSAAAIRANAGTSSYGEGGQILLSSNDSDSSSVTSLDGDVRVEGTLLASSGGLGGDGGSVTVSAGRDLYLIGGVTADGALRGGTLRYTSGRHLTISSPQNASATQADGRAGVLGATAGIAADGTTRLEASIDTAGGVSSAGLGHVSLIGCSVTVVDGTQIDGRAGTDSNGNLGGSEIRLAALSSMSLGANASYKGGNGGTLTTLHPAAVTVGVGSGSTFDPVRVDTILESTNPLLPACGRALE